MCILMSFACTMNEPVTVAEPGILSWGAELFCPDKLKSQIDTILKNLDNICVYENININFLILK